jgi:hypothetical protein
MAMVAALAPQIMEVLGHQWLPAAPALQVLCLVGMVQSCTMLIGPLTYALNKPSINVAIVWIQGLTLCVSFTALGLIFRNADHTRQAVSIACANLGAVTLISVPALVWMMRRCQLRVRDFLWELRPAVLASLAVAAAAWAARFPVLTGLPSHPLRAVPQRWHALIDLTLLSVVGSVVGIVALCAFEPRIREIVLRRLPRFRAAAPPAPPGPPEPPSPPARPA